MDQSNTQPNETSDHSDQAPADPSGQPQAPQPQPVIVQSPKSKRSYKLLVLILIVLVALGAVGYGLQSMWSPAKRTATTKAAAKSDIAQLTVGIVNGSTSLYEPNTQDSYAQSVSNQIYEGLVGYRSTSKIVPLLATGWTNPNDTTWDFDLRHNVTFHNGDTMTAADVVYSLQLATAQGKDGAYSNTIQSVKPLNDYKVEIVTSKPDPFLLNRLTFLFVLDSKQPNATDTVNGTGPFQLKPGTKRTDTELQLVAYDKYHGGHVYTRALTFKIEASEDTAAADLKAGKVNLVGEFNAEQPAQLKDTNFHKFTSDDSSVNFLTLNSVSPGPLQKQAVREALRDSIDLGQMIKNANVAAEPASQLITQAIPGYNPAVPIAHKDIAKAKSLLTQAGYPNGISLTLQTSPSNVDVANELAKQAQEADIKITVKLVDDFDQLINAIVDGKTEVALLSYSSDTLDAGDVFSSVLQQTANFKSAALDDYLSQASGAFDPAQRLKILQKTSKYISDNVAAIPLYSRHRIWMADKPYAIQFETMSANPGIYFWQTYLSR